MGRRRLAVAVLLGAVLPALGATAGPAHAIASCAEPGQAFPTATPAAAGLDRDTLMRVIHSYQDRRGYAVRIYRNGCLVARDTNYGNEGTQYETWEITSGVLALAAAREMTLGLLSPDDPVGALVPEADAAHGAITIAQLLQRTSGLAARPDDIYLRDRLRLALVAPVDAAPGTTFPDAPVARSLLATALGRAAGGDVEGFLASRLFGPLGLRAWRWTRDDAGLPHSTFGLQLTADDTARLAELVRRGGVWRGRRLIDGAWLDAMLAPSARNPCLGWLTWTNAQPGCDGAPQRLLPGLPADLWEWRGRDDQRVTVVPSLGLVVVRYGLAGGDERTPDDELTWERGVLQQLMNAVRDTTPGVTPGGGEVPPATGDPFTDDARNAFAAIPPAPPRGPRRARAVRLAVVRDVAGRARRLIVAVTCPLVAPRGCAGTAALDGVRARPRRWAAVPGATVAVPFRVRRRLRAPVAVTARVVAEDAAGGVPATLAFTAQP